MKILKSGIEVAPKELKKIKGGACACGCNFSSLGLHSCSEEGGGCQCNCILPGKYAFGGTANAPATYL